MQNHPIPQNVTGYEFHLIGNMTVKQFVELGVGIGIGVFFYSLPIPDFVKWPLVVIAVILGAALAFMPFDGRPLDRMVIIFFRAIYSPTQYIWRKNPTIPAYFNFVAKKAGKVDELALERERLRKNINEYIETLPEAQQAQNQGFDQRELAYMQSVGALFNQSPATSQAIPGTDAYVFHQSPKVRVRAMKTPGDVSQKTGQKIQETTMAVSIKVPEDAPVQADTTYEQQEQVVSQAFVTTAPQPQSDLASQYQNQQVNQTALTSQNLPFPKPPTEPNKIVGMVLTQEGRIVDNAIVEIRNEKGQPVSALKTNSLGQFFSTSPLKPNIYQVYTIKQGLTFSPVSIKLENKIINPLEIRALG